MASFRVLNACVFLLVLLLCHEIFVLNVEARHLRSKGCRKCSRQRHRNSLETAKIGGHSNVSGQERSNKMDYVDDFRPTAPGHSPGVGHSINN
ncbi:hypothetical protein COLO4_11385 [Corchorus olitorius]|uniref:Encoded peptide n=1 Tax=Corchorus olitorius TaxID=93759 RepID=A0A1R3K4N2_9ROSI|nr:hypothetical protein COLO4_11385 [Corchorus olitorius]